MIPYLAPVGDRIVLSSMERSGMPPCGNKVGTFRIVIFDANDIDNLPLERALHFQVAAFLWNAA